MIRCLTRGNVIALALAFALTVLGAAAKNIALSKHQIHHHLAWFETKGKHDKAADKHLGPHSAIWGEFWREAFHNVDTDGDGKIRFQQLNDLFKEHYNLYHKVHIEDEEKDQYSLANSAHFTDDSVQFRQWLPADHPNSFTYETLHKLMLAFMDDRHEERKGLMEYAQHVYKADL
eukprot:INCI7273.1.p1 GENE.INCI7273.1~~INCI7273.1.p1  ORF type:complete len:175 (+),score=32.73 INCI7273.1:122-646(+)